MKPMALALVASVALNALLGVALNRPPLGESSQPPAPKAGMSASGSPVAAPNLAALEPEALKAGLRHQNLPPEAVDALVLARIYERHDMRRRELVRAAMQRPWWEVVGG